MLWHPVRVSHSLQHKEDAWDFQKLRLQHLLEAFEIEHIYVIFELHLGCNTPSHPLDANTWLTFLELQ